MRSHGIVLFSINQVGGTGVSAGRSIITHGVLWTLFDRMGRYIDRLPDPPSAGADVSETPLS